MPGVQRDGARVKRPIPEAVRAAIAAARLALANAQRKEPRAETEEPA